MSVPDSGRAASNIPNSRLNSGRTASTICGNVPLGPFCPLQILARNALAHAPVAQGQIHVCRPVSTAPRLLHYMAHIAIQPLNINLFLQLVHCIVVINVNLLTVNSHFCEIRHVRQRRHLRLANCLSTLNYRLSTLPLRGGGLFPQLYFAYFGARTNL